MAKEYRTRTRLLFDVLRTIEAEGEAHTNRILLIANLSYARLQGLLDELQAKAWIEPVPGADRKAWMLTNEGRTVRQSLASVSDLMDDFGLRL
ncbi:MAG: winged helix-turn-helix domain-containing protein [Candidatus Thermoplasmatota archaeon]|jgi:predicted transcriptional regulator